MKIAVTGAAGFIGKEIVQKLLEENHMVISFLKPSQKSIQHRLNKTIYVEDINEFKDWEKNLEGIDILIHSAAKAHITDISKGKWK